MYTQYWKIDTYSGIAYNTHNGNPATLSKTNDGGWILRCVNCPAPFMFDELGKWWMDYLSSHPGFELKDEKHWFDQGSRWVQFRGVC